MKLHSKKETNLTTKLKTHCFSQNGNKKCIHQNTDSMWFNTHDATTQLSPQNNQHDDSEGFEGDEWMDE